MIVVGKRNKVLGRNWLKPQPKLWATASASQQKRHTIAIKEYERANPDKTPVRSSLRKHLLAQIPLTNTVVQIVRRVHMLVIMKRAGSIPTFSLDTRGEREREREIETNPRFVR